MDGDKPPIQADLSRFGLFADQALRLGVSGDQTEQVVREVKASPDGRLTDETRTALVEQVRTDNHLSYDTARDSVNRLEHSAGMLPNEITAFGMVNVPQPIIEVAPQVNVTVQAPADDSDSAYNEAMQKQSALGGSGSVMRGGS